jgi:hypothetical protein
MADGWIGGKAFEMGIPERAAQALLLNVENGSSRLTATFIRLAVSPKPSGTRHIGSGTKTQHYHPVRLRNPVQYRDQMTGLAVAGGFDRGDH